MFYLGMLALATGLGLPIAAFGVGLGQGRAVASAMEGMARQPEAGGQIQTAMIIGLALLEALVIYALLMFFILSGKLPAISTEQAVAMGTAAAGMAGR
jgi:F-type H+-transporting ATPase subunit c